MEIDTLITSSFEDWLANELSGADVRAIEAGKSTSFDWNAIQASGFADAMCPEAVGGAGANLATAGELAFLCGKHAMPFPLATTIFAREALVAQHSNVPLGAITIARADKSANKTVTCRAAPFALASDWVLAIDDNESVLLPCAAGQTDMSGIHGSLLATIQWTEIPEEAVVLTKSRDWISTGAAIYSALIAGAASRVLALSLAYADERKQFGKSLAAFQAIQQRLAVLAEMVLAARIAAQQAFAGDAIDVRKSAVAKAKTSRIVPEVNAIGHMVFGAIGITEECDLQLFTRRLLEWRQCFGGEKHWDRMIGNAVLAGDRDVLRFILSVTPALN